MHGDIRSLNILVRKDLIDSEPFNRSMLLIDFEWGGKASETRYPINLNTELHRHSKATSGQPITVEHDMYMLDLLFPC